MLKYFERTCPTVASVGRTVRRHHVISQSPGGLQRGKPRTVRRNQPCCIKIVKWFYPTLVEHLQSFAKLAYARLAPNEKKRLGRSREEATSGTRLCVPVFWSVDCARFHSLIKEWRLLQIAPFKSLRHRIRKAGACSPNHLWPASRRLPMICSGL